jgi:hypothetical protein
MRLRASSRYPHEPMFIVLTFTQISFEPYDLLWTKRSSRKISAFLRIKHIALEIIFELDCPITTTMYQNTADADGQAAGLVGFARHRIADETLGGPLSEIPRNKRVKRTLLHLTGPAVGPEME